MLHYIAVAASLAVGATVVYAQNVDAIKARQDAMKSNAAAAKQLSAMAKGEAPFDAAKIQELLRSLEATAGKLKTMFPNDSKTGAKTRALPAIWEKRAAFEAAVDKFGAI